MASIFWIVVGAMTGFACSKMVYKNAETLIRDVLVGILGALAGGFIYHRLGFNGPHGLSFGGTVIAVSGAIILLMLYHVGGSRKVSHA